MVLIQLDKFTNHNRSQRGMGINSNFTISEYKGKIVTFLLKINVFLNVIVILRIKNYQI